MAAGAGDDQGVAEMNYLSDDAEASAIARKLRGFSDTAVAWIEHLSSVNMDLICAVLDTEPHIMVLASRYEAARRRAFLK